MAASNTDLFRKNAPLFSTTLNGAISASSTSIVMQAVSGLPTDTGLTLVIDATDAQGNLTPAKQETVKGVVSAGTVSLINAIRGVEGTAQSHATGATVYGYVTAADHNDTITGILTQHKQDGTHTGITTDTITATTGTFTNLTVTGSNTAAGWSPLGQTLTYASNNGNKEFTATAAADLRNTLSPGMKLQVTRNTVPPTQCMAFSSASSQYATKASPTGLSFTSAFTCEAWVYVQSYTAGDTGIIGRGTAGTTGAFALAVSASGQVDLIYKDGTNALTQFLSYQSIPLNQMVHIAGVVSSVTTKTAALYINGSLVPSFTNFGNATTLAQSGSLDIGRYATNYFNGYISEARIWSVAQTQTQIQNNMAINLVGNETNLVGLFQGSGNFNDLTSNANSLTATNGAIATQANNPYNAIEYASVISVTYSSPNTTISLRCQDGYSIPNQALNSPQYSTAGSPFGYPLPSKILASAIYCAQLTTTATGSLSAVPGGQVSVTLPANARIKVSLQSPGFTTSGATAQLAQLGLMDGSSTIANMMGVITNSSNQMAGFLPVARFNSGPGGAKTYNIAATAANAGTSTLTCGINDPMYLTVELDG